MVALEAEITPGVAGSFGFEFPPVAVTLAMAYLEAKTIHLNGQNNLNIHRRKPLADVFGADVEVWNRFTVHTRPLTEVG